LPQQQGVKKNNYNAINRIFCPVSQNFTIPEKISPKNKKNAFHNLLEILF
jgi:hypothetical protein